MFKPLLYQKNVMSYSGGGEGSASYILDTYPAFAAYSTRKLSSTATNCMIVTEDGGGTEATIGFSADWLDEAAIATHCGASTGSVAKWYDQSGNLNFVDNSVDASQPEIYNGSSVIKDNLKPALSSGGGMRVLNRTVDFTAGAQSQPITIFCIGNIPAAGKYLYDGRQTSKALYLRTDASNTYINAGADVSVATAYSGLQYLYSSLYNTTSSILRVNATQVATGNVGAEQLGNITLLANAGKTISSDFIQEYILFTSDQTANFAAIEADINAAFGVYA